MKSRFIKGARSRTIICRNKIVYAIMEEFHPVRIDLNKFNVEKERLMAANENNKKLLDLLEQVSKLANDKEIMGDIEKDYLNDGWRKA